MMNFEKHRQLGKLLPTNPPWVFENKWPGARAGHFPSFFSLFYNAKKSFFENNPSKKKRKPAKEKKTTHRIQLDSTFAGKGIQYGGTREEK
jgi:hypothetical protein